MALRDIFAKCKRNIFPSTAKKEILLAKDKIVFKKMQDEFFADTGIGEYSIVGTNKELSLIFHCGNLSLEQLEDSKYRGGQIFFFIMKKIPLKISTFDEEVESYWYKQKDSCGIEDVSFIHTRLFELLIKNFDIINENESFFRGYRAAFTISKEDFYNYILPHMIIYK